MWKVCKDITANYAKEFHVEYNRFLSNHMSHETVALTSMGASEERVREVAKAYSAKLEAPSAFPIDAPQYPIVTLDGIMAFRGVRRQFYDLLTFYENEIRDLGVEATLKEYLPHLLAGVPGAAFHTIIHLGYNFHLHEKVSEEGGEYTAGVAEGLAYLTHSNLPFNGRFELNEKPLSPGGASIPEDSNGVELVANAVPQILSAAAELQPILALELRANDEYSKLDIGSFQRGMTAFTRSLSLGKGLDELSEEIEVVFSAIAHRDGPIALAEAMCHAAALMHQLTGADDFFVLHGVTGSWSLLQVAKYLTPGQAAFACLCMLRGIAAAYVVQDCPALQVQGVDEETVPAWEALLKQAVATDADEHMHKCVQVLHDMSKIEALQQHKEIYRSLAFKVSKKTQFDISRPVRPDSA